MKNNTGMPGCFGSFFTWRRVRRPTGAVTANDTIQTTGVNHLENCEDNLVRVFSCAVVDCSLYVASLHAFTMAAHVTFLLTQSPKIG